MEKDTNIEEENLMIEREKHILGSIIRDMRPDIAECIDDYCACRDNDAKDLVALKNEAVSNIIEVFLRAANRINRFSEYKSKTRILSKADKLSQREQDRCGFILRVMSKNCIKVIKDDVLNTKGEFKRR